MLSLFIGFVRIVEAVHSMKMEYEATSPLARCRDQVDPETLYVGSWLRARVLTGVQASVDLQTSLRRFIYSSLDSTEGFYYSTDNGFAYVKVPGAKSDVVVGNILKNFPEASFATPSDFLEVEARSPCLVTFVRDPIVRWARAYAEVEYKIKDEPKAFLQSIPSGVKLRFLDYEEGSTLRVKAFLRDYVDGKLLAYPEMKRFVPQFAFLRRVPYLKYIGRAERLSTDFPQFLKTCAMAARSFDPSQRDPQAETLPPLARMQAYKAAKDLLENDEGFARVICQLAQVDYVCLGISLPPSCRSFIRDPSQNRTAIARAGDRAEEKRQESDSQKEAELMGLQQQEGGTAVNLALDVQSKGKAGAEADRKQELGHGAALGEKEADEEINGQQKEVGVETGLLREETAGQAAGGVAAGLGSRDQVQPLRAVGDLAAANDRAGAEGAGAGLGEGRLQDGGLRQARSGRAASRGQQFGDVASDGKGVGTLQGQAQEGTHGDVTVHLGRAHDEHDESDKAQALGGRRM